MSQNSQSQGTDPKPSRKKVGVFIWIIRIIFLPIWLLYEITKWGIKSIKVGGSTRIVGAIALGVVWLIVLVGVITSFSQSSGSEQKSDQPAATNAEVGQISSESAAATATKRPINTPKPTSTQMPSLTPAPTKTPTEPPPPQAFSGNGDDVVMIEGVGPAVVDLNYSGGSNFIVTNYDSSGQQIGLLVNTIGSYNGRVELDFYDDENTAMLEIKADGPWTVTVTPLGEADLRKAISPGTFVGSGDDVIFLSGDPTIGSFINQGESNFVVWSIGDSIDLIVNEIAPYSGTAIIPNGTFILIVKAESEWSAEFK
ncbi:MAG: hypothetical protein ACYDGL_13175 [Bellilinea sp.]